MFQARKPVAIPSAAEALPGREARMATDTHHFVTGRALQPPFPEGIEIAYLGLGCFWGAERKFWELGEGIFTTAVGYMGGATPNPTYEEVCSGMTGHTEVVLVAFDPRIISYETLLKTFFENHNPTQGMRQGNDVGTQYRSALYVTDERQKSAAENARRVYGEALSAQGHPPVTTEIQQAGPFYYAEGYHQQYLAKNPNGYCGIGGTGVACQIGTGVTAGP